MYMYFYLLSYVCNMATIRFRGKINFCEFYREERTTGGGSTASSAPIASSTTITISGSRPTHGTTVSGGETPMEVAEDPEPEIITVSGWIYCIQCMLSGRDLVAITSVPGFDSQRLPGFFSLSASFRMWMGVMPSVML